MQLKALCLFLIVSLQLGSAFNSAALAQTTAEIAKGNCKACSDTCQKTLDYCVKKKGKYAVASVTDALKDCIMVCNMDEKVLNHNSNLQKKAAALNIDACNAAAKACDQF